MTAQPYNEAQDRYIAGLIIRVSESASDGGARAQVAALVVRGIVRLDDSDPEYSALVEAFGRPTLADWRMAQAAYGPKLGVPGLRGDDTGMRTYGQRWAPMCQQCWQDAHPTEYCPDLTDMRTCVVCGEYALTVMVHPEETR